MLFLALHLQCSPFNLALSPPIITLLYHEPSPTFCHGIASPHLPLAFFGFVPIEFGET